MFYILARWVVSADVSRAFLALAISLGKEIKIGGASVRMVDRDFGRRIRAEARMLRGKREKASKTARTLRGKAMGSKTARMLRGKRRVSATALMLRGEIRVSATARMLRGKARDSKTARMLRRKGRVSATALMFREKARGSANFTFGSPIIFNCHTVYGVVDFAHCVVRTCDLTIDCVYKFRGFLTMNGISEIRRIMYLAKWAALVIILW